MQCYHAGFAGADYDLQDALVESTDKSSSKGERHGQSFYDYELAGPVNLFVSAGDLHDQCQTVIAFCLQTSLDIDLQHLWG